MMKKHIGKADPTDRFSCALCGDRQIVSGIIFKGRCICSECVKYLSAGSLSTDETTKAPVFFPDQFRVSPSSVQTDDAESYDAAAESKYRYGAETKPAETAKRQEKRKQEKGKKEEEKEQQTPKEEREKQSDEK